jgi:hypothetical protein
LVIGFIIGVFSIYVFAETTAEIKDCEITITIKLAFKGDGATDRFINKTKRAVDKLWNKDFTYGDCKCPVEVVVDIIKVNDCPPPNDRHCITIKNDTLAPGQFHRSWVRVGKWKSPKISSGNGIWHKDDTENVIAHELGHLLGLPDEYSDVNIKFNVSANGTITITSITVIYGSMNASFAQNASASFINKSASGWNLQNGSSYTINVSLQNPDTNSSSLMGTAAATANANILQQHIDKICKDAGITCPDECCCKHGIIDPNKGVYCNPKATPSGCKEPEEYCTKDCKCKKKEKEVTVPPEDSDEDGIADTDDNCPLTPNPEQEDMDGDWKEDCVYAGELEGLPYYIFVHENGQEYSCGGNACDYDNDNDLVPDGIDLCPETFYAVVDINGCLI